MLQNWMSKCEYFPCWIQIWWCWYNIRNVAIKYFWDVNLTLICCLGYEIENVKIINLRLRNKIFYFYIKIMRFAGFLRVQIHSRNVNISWTLHFIRARSSIPRMDLDMEKIRETHNLYIESVEASRIFFFSKQNF